MASNGSPNTPRRPADHKPPADEPFIWPVGDTKVELPSFKSLLTFGRARRLRKLPESDQLFTMLEEALDEDTLMALDPLTQDEMEQMFNAWQEHSGIDLGESSGSSS